MNDEQRRAYSRGYNAGSRGRWPEHKPPLPPDETIQRMILAMRKLRDTVDGQLATILEDDPWQEILGNPIDEVDAVLIDVSRWLKAAE